MDVTIDSKVIGQRLQKIRKLKGLTQAEMATHLRQHRINGRIHIGGHAFCENQQDALCICSQGHTDSSCQAGPVSQNQVR